MKTHNGLFIVIDGTDGSGKATQTELLLRRIIAQGRDARKIDFPRYGTNMMGGFLAECLGKKPGTVMPVDSKAFLAADPRLASIVYAVDRMESSDEIKGWLEKGVVVIADRYASSNQIHQAGKIHDPKTRDSFIQWLDDLEYKVCKIPRPDIIVYLHVPVEVSMRLARERAVEKGESADVAETDAKHQYESQESALSMVRSANNWVKVDCADEKGQMLSREAIAEKVFAAISDALLM
jgi:thymidylate kinase